MAISGEAWLDVMRREYFARFVPEGGSATKFLVFPDDPRGFVDELRGEADKAKLWFVPIDAATTKIHMIQDVFFAIARHVPWESLAQRWIEMVFMKNAYRWTNPGEAIPFQALAAANNVDETLLKKRVDEWLTDMILRDRDLALDFRSAMASLCRGRMEAVEPGMVAPVMEWLRGELRTIGPVRQVPINSKITRHNARAMLRSLCHWLRVSGEPGLLVALDIRQAVMARPESGNRYTAAAAIDLYEVLRQLIDDGEKTSGLFVAVICDPAFRDGDPKRSVFAVYPALRERIWPDVHARGHDNPVAPMIQIDQAGHSSTIRRGADLPISEERVAVEALRTGVPNRTAIRFLGGGNDAVMARFEKRLSAAASAQDGPIEPGEILEGHFGGGKSHLLGAMAEFALDRHFVVSIVSVSKETPLFDPTRFFLSAARAAVVPGANDDVMTAVLARLANDAGRHAALEDWASGPDSGLSPVFAALLYLLPRHAIGTEERAAIARFFAGHKLGIPRVRQWLRAAGALKLFAFSPLRAADLALQQIAFAPRLFAAAGFSGWCILIDEVELIGRYSSLQRAKSFAELARWLGLVPKASHGRIVTAAAVTEDFADVMMNRQDDEKLPRLLRDRGLDDQADLAVAALEALQHRAIKLLPPDEGRLRASLGKVHELYERSYAWSPPETDIGERLRTKTMRGFIKSWITGWDLERLYGASGDIAVDEMPTDYVENQDLEKATAGEAAEEEA